MVVKLGDAIVYLRGDKSALQKDLKSAEGDTKSWASSLTGHVQGIGKGVMVAAGAVVAATAAAGVGLLKLAVDAAPLEGIQAAFRGISTAAGQSTDTLLASLQRASSGMVSARELMMSYNSAAMLVNDQFANQMPEAFAMLSKVSAATGQDMGYLIDSLVRGVGRLSPLILDNLMLQVDLNAAFEAWKQANGALGRELTKTEKQMATMDAVMAKLRQNTASLPEVAGSAAASVGGLQARLGNLKDTVGMALLPAMKEFFGTASGFLDTIGPLMGQAGKLISAAGVAGIGAVKAFVKALAKAMGVDLDAVAANAEGYGANIVVSLAEGMVSAAVAVLQAMQGIGRLITSWLKPGSPPRLLPDLDRWGAAAASIYMSGWANADFGVFGDLTSTIRGYLESLSEDVLPEEQKIPFMASLQAGIAEGINNLRDMARGGRGVFDELLASAGLLPDSVLEYARALVDVRNATEAVERAQNELNAVTQRYDALLAPLSAEMQQIEDRRRAIQDEQRLAELREQFSDASLGAADRELVALEMREIALRQQMQTVQRDRDAAVDAAQEKLDAAQEAERQAQDEARRRKAVVDAQVEANSQLEKQASLLSQIAEGARKMGQGLKAGLSGVKSSIEESLGGLTMPTLDTAGLDDLATRLEQAFAPLNTEAEETGTVWGEVVNTIIAKWNEVLEIPVVAQALEWIGQFVTLEDVLIALGIAVGAVVVPALLGIAETVATVALVIAGLVALVAGVRNAWETDFLGIRTMIEIWVAALIAFWQENGATILATIQGFLNQTIADVSAFLTAIWVRIQPAVTAIRVFVGQVLTAIAQFWKAHSTEILLVVGVFLKALETVFRVSIDMVKNVVLLALDLLTGNWDQFGKDLQSAAETFWKIIENIWGVSLDDIKGALTGWITGISSQVKTWFDDQIDKFNKFGENLVGGIQRGWNKQWIDFRDNVATKVKEFIDWLRALLGIASDSKVTTAMGEHLAGGLIGGWVKRLAGGLPMDLVQDSLDQLAGLGSLVNASADDNSVHVNIRNATIPGVSDGAGLLDSLQAMATTG